MYIYSGQFVDPCPTFVYCVHMVVAENAPHTIYFITPEGHIYILSYRSQSNFIALEFGFQWELGKKKKKTMKNLH